MNELFSFCDDHFKIFILIWLKLREYYSEAKNKSLTLPFIVKKTSKFIKNIRKQCIKIPRFKKIAKFVYFIEIELSESERFIEKLQHFALISEIFELPEPISGIIKQLGLDGGDDLENNVFSKKINDLFKNIDDIDLEKKVDIIEDTMQEGTLLKFLKNKKPIQEKVEKEEKEEKEEKKYPIYYNSTPVFRNISISRIPRIGVTPNPRTIYRHH